MSKNRQALRPVDVANWLKQNPTVDGRPATINDGKLAVNWPEWEKTLKIKKGNLRENLPILQLARKSPETSGEATRAASLRKRDQIFKDTLRQAGLPEEEINAIFKKDKKEFNRIRREVTKINKKLGPNTVSLGHIRAVAAGGGNFAPNSRIEPGRGEGGNYSRQHKDEIPDHVSAVQGVARKGKGGYDDALQYLLWRDSPQLDPRTWSDGVRGLMLEAGGDGDLINDMLTEADKPNSRFKSILDKANLNRADQLGQLGISVATGDVLGTAVGATSMAASEFAQSPAGQKVIAEILAKRAAKSGAKLIPGVDVGISALEAFGYAKEGKLDQAGIAALSGLVGWVPVIGDGAAAALDVTNTAIDISRLDLNNKPDPEINRKALRPKL